MGEGNTVTTGEYLFSISSLTSGTALEHLLNIQSSDIITVPADNITASFDEEIIMANILTIDIQANILADTLSSDIASHTISATIQPKTIEADICN